MKCARSSTEIESREFVQTGVISFSKRVNWSEMMVLIEGQFKLESASDLRHRIQTHVVGRLVLPACKGTQDENQKQCKEQAKHFHTLYSRRVGKQSGLLIFFSP